MTLTRNGLCVLLLACFLRPAASAPGPGQVRALPPAAARKIEFSRDVKPIFEASCVQCHGKGRDKGGFQVDTRTTLLKGGDSGQAVIPGSSAQSLLIQLVSGLDPDNVMPRKGKRLTPEQVGILRAWIDQSLPWDEGVTFAKAPPLNLKRRAPALAKMDSARNPVDQILEAYFARTGFKLPAPVDDRIFVRRVYLDAVGLLPPPKELESFVADTRPEKRKLLVRRLLDNSEGYADNWLTFWNDLLRNDYRGTGYIDGGRKQITPWLYEALRTNLAYDQFVAQLINPRPDTEGFTKGIVWRGVVNASQQPEMQAAQNISQVFMGVNLKCASCHDSFINDWKLSDAYGLASIYSEQPLEEFRCDKPTGQMAVPKFIYPELGEIDPKASRSNRLERLAEIISGPNDGRLSRTIVNRFWGRLFGRALVEPVDDMEQPAWDQDLLDWLGEDLVSNQWDLKKTLECILTSDAYQLPAVNLAENEGKAFQFRGPAVRRLSAEQFRDAIAQVTGAWCDKADFGGATNQVRASFVATDPLMTALGRPSREQVVTVRATAATTLQGLELTNGKTLADVLERGARQLTQEFRPSSEDTSGKPSADALIERIFLQALGRQPKPDQGKLARELVGSPVRGEGVEDLLWAVCMLPEFQLIY